MGLPGLTTSQMIEVDRVMMNDLCVPIELMMEHAGHNLARLVIKLSDHNVSSFRIVTGTGNNGGGGLVAARRLRGWGFKTEVILPRSKNLMREIPVIQLKRATNAGVNIINGIPEQSSDGTCTVIDAYLGYGFKPRRNDISESVYTYLRRESHVVSLDVPSGLDSTSGESYSQLRPIATMSTGFLKMGHLLSSHELTGDLFVADIGIPSKVYKSKINLAWNDPYSLSDLESLYNAFSQDPLQSVSVSISRDKPVWTVGRPPNQKEICGHH
jgi:NAD(P)H-hydrate epimerase